MANMAAKIVASYLTERGIKIHTLEDNLLEGGWALDNGSINIFLQFDDEGTHVHLEGLRFTKAPADKFDALYKLLNTLNAKYSHIKFILDEKNGEIIARDDAVIQLDSCGEECHELIRRMLAVVNDAYKDLMKVMWA